ncbi:MAG TPA: DMT family transporter [Casimicrobiaceae bacterium]|nr:DMT family transporter [Casimicrobiaceae bacterium]
MVVARTPASGAHGADWVGPALAVVGVLGFSFKAILIKLAYAWEPIDALTLLTLRMVYSAPIFLAMALFAHRRGTAPVSRGDWLRILWLGFVGYYLASLVDFMGLAYVTAALERLMLYLYPTIVVVLSAIFLRQPITRRMLAALALSYAGIVLVFGRDLRVAGDPHALWLGGALVFASAFLYAVYLVCAGPVIVRLGSLRFISLAMLASTVFVLIQFAATRPLASLAAPMRIQLLSLAMAVFSTVLPTLFVAEAIKRIGANRASLLGSLGPLFTIVFGAWLLGEAVQGIQLAGAALVLAGVTLVTLKPRSARRQAPA